MSEKENIVITGMARTPMGAFQGTLKERVHVRAIKFMD